MLEHTHELGPALADIAWHKAGIVKPENIVVSATQEPEALEVAEREAALQGAELRLLGRDFGAAFVRGGDLDTVGLAMTLRTPARDYGELWLPLLGRYQVENTAVAVSAVEALLEQLGERHDDEPYRRAVREGLARVVWPGRCQVLVNSPLVFLDGAINDESARLFRESVADLVRPPVSALVSVPDTKDFLGVFRQMAGIASSVVITRFETPYLTFPDDEEALRAAREFFPTAAVRPDFAAAYEEARRLAGDEGTVLIVGTQSLSKAALRHWGFSLEVL
jgi:dihydrofolate synthase/folylpolyglutamate synthase